MVGDQHTNAACLEEADDALDLDHGDGVNARKGLVQQDKARLGGEGAGDLDAAALATGQGQGRRCTQVVHTQLLQQGRQALLDGVARQRLAVVGTLQLQHCTHVFFDGELAENGGFLRQVRQPQP